MKRKRTLRHTSRRMTRQSARTISVPANVLVKSASGQSILAAGSVITPRNVKNFLPTRASLEEARRRLMELGFEIDLVAETHISIRGRKELYEKVFQIRLTQKAAPYFRSSKNKSAQVYFVPTKPPTIPEGISRLIETIEFPGPVEYYESATPPALAYDHMEVPDDVARDMDALKVHSRAITGTGIRLAVVDSGFMTPFHAYYAGKGYNIQPLIADPADPAPNDDSIGHGTGVSACALAVAPGVTFFLSKHYQNFAADFTRAVMQAPHIISNSWGLPSGAEPTLRLAINNAVANGIVVLFACGNEGTVSWPGSEPAVISVGGAFIGNNDSIQASNYASSGTSIDNPGRQCPDLCGITGQSPHGILIALPTQPGSDGDNTFSGFGDGTTVNDGWLVASGTSSATPMVAGVAALVMQANPAALGNPTLVRSILVGSCVDVTTGSSASGEAAGPGADLATGAGLVQAYRAVRTTDLWIRDNANSDIGLVPTHGRRPAWPPFAHWVSPDIKVFSSPLANPAAEFDPTPSESPIFKQDNYVYVRIRNRGNQPTGSVDTRLYYADPATNLVFPFDWKEGQSGIPAQGSIEVGGVGTNLQTFPSVAAGGQDVLPLPFVWQPPDPTTATQTQVLPDGRTVGHFCLLVRLETLDDPIIFPAGGESSVINDNNIGMSNQQVYSAPVGQMFAFAFYVRGGTDREPIRSHDLLFDLSSLPRGCVVNLRLDRKLVDAARLINGKRRKEDIALNVGKKPAGLQQLIIKPDAKALARISIKIPSNAKPNDYQVTVAQSSGGRALGGMTLVARATKSRLHAV